jgi:hypothetical protein
LAAARPLAAHLEFYHIHLSATEAAVRAPHVDFCVGAHEQRPNAYVTRELSLEFHYFFMRKLWFAHLARALAAFPGGFGTLAGMRTREQDRPSLDPRRTQSTTEPSRRMSL